MQNGTTRPRQVNRPGRSGDPRPLGPQRHGTVPIMPRELHEAWCDFPAQTRDGARRDLAFCAGCGLYVHVGRPGGAAGDMR